MPFAAALRGLMALVVTSTGAWATALTVLEEPSATGQSGDYVTLGFPLLGSGEYEFTVQATEGWHPLNQSGRVVVDGEGYVSVTLRVPRSAPALSQAEVVISFVASDDPGDTATARGTVDVLPTVAIELLAPGDQVGTLGEPFSLALQVANRGNSVDSVALSGDGGMWDVRFSANPVRLEPGEKRQIEVVLVPRGQVSSGYRQILRVTATSTNDPAVSERAAVETVFTDAAHASNVVSVADPMLTLALRSGVTAGLRIEGDDATPSISYDVNPRLNGELSDYVDVSAGFGSLTGSIADPFARVPSRVDLVLEAENWDAAASAGDGSYSLAGGGLVGDWRVGGGGNYRAVAASDSFRVNAYAISQLSDLDLQFAGSSAWRPEGRSDILSARYRTRLGDGSLALSAGTNVTGNLTPTGYLVTFGINESLSYQTQSFDVTQSYSGVPASGLHNLGVSGGLRSSGVFGARASSSVQLSPGSSTWRHSVTLTSRPIPRVGLALTGTLRSAPASTTWSLRPTATFRYGGTGFGGTFSVNYAHTGVLRGDAATSDSYGAGVTFRYGNLSLGAATRLRSSGATSTEPGGQSFEVSVDADYTLGLRTQLTAGFEHEQDAVTGQQTSAGELAWTQAWSADVSSRLSYERSQAVELDTARTDIEERIAFIGQFTDLWLDGLDLSAGYAVSSNNGLFTGSQPVAHDLSVRLAYTLLLSFDTPPSVVELFGGRRGGEVSGVAFLDRNLDGLRGPDEEVVAGLEVELGGERVVTGADGSFRLRTGVGSHEWTFGGGLPGSVKLLNDDIVEITENSTQVIDLAFSPVVRVPVTIFDDADGDGMRDEGEGGISFAGVRFDGPIALNVRMDSRGSSIATGLVPGRYVVTVDPDALPSRYRATTGPHVLEVVEGVTPEPIELGAGAPPREIVTTFTAGSLAIIGRVDTRRVEAGETVTVTALVSGPARSVTATLGDLTIELADGGAMWSGQLVVPRDHPGGATVITIRARSQTDREADDVETEVALEVIATGD